MKPTPIHITIKAAGRLIGGRQLFKASVNGMEYLGGSPDEALGNAMRELELEGITRSPILIRVTRDY